MAAALAALAVVSSARAVPFAPGEETLLQVRVLSVLAGEARIAVGRPEGIVWPVFFQARTSGIAGLVDIREHLVSYWDAVSRLPRGSDLRALEAGDLHVDRSRFDRAGSRATLVRERKGRRSERTFTVPEGAHDLTSAFLWLRLQRLAPGDTHELPIVSGNRQFRLRASVAGHEEVETPAGTFRCVRVDVHTPVGGAMSTRGDVALWLTDDPAHVLIRVSAPFVLGQVVAELTRYSPGGRPVRTPRRPPGPRGPRRGPPRPARASRGCAR
jgi:hypothetical protein